MGVNFALLLVTSEFYRVRDTFQPSFHYKVPKFASALVASSNCSITKYHCDSDRRRSLRGFTSCAFSYKIHNDIEFNFSWFVRLGQFLEFFSAPNFSTK